MATDPLRTALHHLRRTLGAADAGVSDGELLQRFVADRDEAAFELLVRRHERLVLGVCRRVLHDPHDAEDAFQATFLVLARKAAGISARDSVAGWLYRVAYRVALRARAGAAGRHEHATPDLSAVPAPDDADRAAAWRELRPLLDREVGRLPEKYRVPVILCYLESRTYEEAARQLGCSRGTVSTRLTRARELLRRRLTRCGLALSGAVLALLLAEQAAEAAAPDGLVDATVKASLPFAAGRSAAGLVSAQVLTLTEGALNAMFLTKLKAVAGVLVVVTLLGLGAGALTRVGAAGDPPAKNARDEKPSPAAPRTSGLDQSVQEPAPVPIQDEPAPDDNTAPWQVRSTITGGQDEFTSLAFSPDGRLLAAANLDGSVQLWDPASAKELRRFNTGSPVRSAAFSPDGKVLATGGGARQGRGQGKLFDVSTGKELAVFEGALDGGNPLIRFRDISQPEVTAVAFSPDGATLGYASRGRTVTLWDVGQRRQRTSMTTSGGIVFSVAFSPDGTLFAAAGGNEFLNEEDKSGGVELFEATTGKPVRALTGIGNTITSVAFAPDGKRLATGGFDKGVRVWDVVTGREISRSEGHGGVVRSVAFSPDGQTLASGSFDGTVKLWDADAGKTLATLQGPGGGVLSVAFSPDGRLLAAGGGEPGKPGRARLWDVGRAPAKPGRAKGALGRLDRLLGELLDSKRSDEDVLEALYLATLARLPTEAEAKPILKHVGGTNRRQAFKDALWALINSAEFEQRLKEWGALHPENVGEFLKNVNEQIRE
jgi:RNA polymerase sigma factor (sigma-70 family)